VVVPVVVVPVVVEPVVVPPVAVPVPVAGGVVAGGSSTEVPVVGSSVPTPLSPAGVDGVVDPPAVSGADVVGGVVVSEVDAVVAPPASADEVVAPVLAPASVAVSATAVVSAANAVAVSAHMTMAVSSATTRIRGPGIRRLWGLPADRGARTYRGLAVGERGHLRTTTPYDDRYGTNLIRSRSSSNTGCGQPSTLDRGPAGGIVRASRTGPGADRRV
jgi:hypothetical protein